MIAVAREHRVGTIVAAVVALALVAAAGFGIYSLLSRSGPVPFENFTITQVTNTGKADEAAVSPDGRYILNVQNDRWAAEPVAPQRTHRQRHAGDSARGGLLS